MYSRPTEAAVSELSECWGGPPVTASDFRELRGERRSEAVVNWTRLMKLWKFKATQLVLEENCGIFYILILLACC